MFISRYRVDRWTNSFHKYPFRARHCAVLWAFKAASKTDKGLSSGSKCLVVRDRQQANRYSHPSAMRRIEIDG